MRGKSGRVVVVGAGLGGISAAISLAAEGYRVEIYEKNKHVGGKLNLLESGGYSFDLGPSILTMPHIFEDLFARHGRRMSDYVSLRAVLPHWRNFFEDGTRIDLYPDPADTVSSNEGLDERDGADLRRFLEHSKALYEHAAPGYFERGFDTIWQMVRFCGVRSALRDFDLFYSMAGGVAKYVRNRHLQDVLNFFVKYVGSSAYDAPGVLNLLFYVQCAFGLWYVEGGMFRLAQALDRLMREVGVAVETGAEVVGFDRGRDGIEAARLADGRRVPGDVFVCNMEVIPASARLLGESEGFLRKFRRFEPACSGLVLHLGMDCEYPHLAHHNFFFSKDPVKHFDDVFHAGRLPEDPTIYLVAVTRTDRSQAPPGCENIKILPHIPHLKRERFSSEDYARLKERVLDKLERMGLKLRGHIVVEDMWTPEDIEATYYSNRGAIYGVVADRKMNRGFKAPKRSSKYPNLYFVGGSVNPGGGMPMAALSGQQVGAFVVRDRHGRGA